MSAILRELALSPESLSAQQLAELLAPPARPSVADSGPSCGNTTARSSTRSAVAASSWDPTTSCPAETGGQLNQGLRQSWAARRVQPRTGRPACRGSCWLSRPPVLLPGSSRSGRRTAPCPGWPGRHAARPGYLMMSRFSAISGPTSTSKKPEAPAVRPQPDQPESIPARPRR